MKKLYPLFCVISSILILSLVVATLTAKRTYAANINHNYPRLANYFLVSTLNQSMVDSLKKWDIVILNSDVGYSSPSKVASIKAQNPNAVLLSYVNTMIVTKRGAPDYDRHYNYLKLLAAEASGSPGWWLYDQYRNHVIRWPNTWSLNLSDVSPVYNGKRWSEYLSDFVRNEIVRDYPWDGIFYDDAHQHPSWMNNGNLDLNNDGIKDSSSYINEHWSRGLESLFSRTRANLGGGALIIGNGNFYLYGNANGRIIESFPRYGGGNWNSLMSEYNTWMAKGVFPRLVIINGNNGNTGDQLSNLKNMRFTLTSTLLGDGYFSYNYGDTNHGQLWWYDEYSVDANGNATGDGSAKGYLGQPQGTAFRLSNGVWRRNYDRGIVLSNPTSSTQTVNLEKTYKKIRGTQSPTLNNGSFVNSVTISSQDGIILLGQNQGSSFPSGGGGSGSPSTSSSGGGTAPAPSSPSDSGGSAPATISSALGEIFGRVVNGAVQVILGTAVRAHHEQYGDWIVPTNPGGEFRISNLPTGIYTMFYDAPGYLSQLQELIPVYENQTARPPMVIMSSSTGEIYGKVMNGAGKRILGTSIRIDSTIIPTNRAGEYRFTLVHPGIYTTYYDAPGYTGKRILVEVKAGIVTSVPTVIMSQ